jgi:hypothetical protein
MLGFDPVKFAKNQLVKMDLNRDKIPDVYQALDAAEAGFEALAKFLDDIDQVEIEVILNTLNTFRKPDKQKNALELKAIAVGLVQIPNALRQAKAALEGAEAELKKS